MAKVKLKVTRLFFDRAAVLAAVDKATVRALSKIGSFLRTRARSSMHRRKRPSMPGSPPHVHGAGQLKNLLFFSYDPASKSVVVGPEKLGRGEAPPLEEFGGTTQRRKRLPTTGRKASPAQAKAYQRKLRNGTLVARARPTVTYQAKYPPRPFMAPALRAEIAAGTMPKQWQNAVRSNT